MSWSVSSIGKSDKVREALAKQFKSHGTCPEPEESHRQAAAALIDKVLENTSPKSAVRIVACGSQWSENYSDPTSGLNHNLQINIEHVPGFVE